MMDSEQVRKLIPCQEVDYKHTDGKHYGWAYVIRNEVTACPNGVPEGEIEIGTREEGKIFIVPWHECSRLSFPTFKKDWWRVSTNVLLEDRDYMRD